MNLPKGALRWPSRISGDGDHLPQAANFKAEHLPYRSEREQFWHDTLPWLISVSLGLCAVSANFFHFSRVANSASLTQVEACSPLNSAPVSTSEKFPV